METFDIFYSKGKYFEIEREGKLRLLSRYLEALLEQNCLLETFKNWQSNSFSFKNFAKCSHIKRSLQRSCKMKKCFLKSERSDFRIPFKIVARLSLFALLVEKIARSQLKKLNSTCFQSLFLRWILTSTKQHCGQKNSCTFPFV